MELARTLGPRSAIWLLVALAALGGGAVLLRQLALGPALAVGRPTRRAIVQTVVSSGRVLAPAQITLASFISSTVAEILVDEGQSVRAGQLLLRLDDRELAAAERRAAALLAQSNAGALQVRRLSLPVARERLRQSGLALAQARRDVAQNEALFREGAVPSTTLDQVRTQLGVVESQAEAARLQLETAGERGAETLSAAAALDLANAEVAAARLALERTRVTAPLQGVVIERAVDVGDSVQPGTRLFVISATGNTRLVIEPDERNLALLRIGQHARASAEAFPEQSFDAELSYIAPSVDARRGTIEVRLSVPNPPAYLRPDMTVSVEVEVARRSDALVLPASALRELSARAANVLVLEAGRVARRKVQPGLVSEGTVEIVRGLSTSDVVIVDPAANPKIGTRARPSWSEP